MSDVSDNSAEASNGDCSKEIYYGDHNYISPTNLAVVQLSFVRASDEVTDLGQVTTVSTDQVTTASTDGNDGTKTVVSSDKTEETLQNNQNPGRKCDFCDKMYKQNSSRHRHIRKCHKTERIEKLKQNGRAKCIEPGCEAHFYHMKAMMEHIASAHRSVDCVNLTFNTWDEFLDWKINTIELPNYLNFVRNLGRKLIGDAEYIYYVCSKDGKKREFVPKTDRKNKSVLKTGLVCPSRMYIKKDSKGVHVQFINAHNHELKQSDLVHQQMDILTRKEVEDKLIMGVPKIDILKGLQEGKAGVDPKHKGPTRRSLTNYKKIVDIERRLRSKSQGHPDEAASLSMQIDTLMALEDSPVLVWKPQGSRLVKGNSLIDNLPGADDLFMLGLQSKQQREMLEAHGSKILCIDSSYCVEEYDYELFNMVVVDEEGQGYTVGHLVANTMDERVFELFFRSVQDEVPGLQLSCVMTDDERGIVTALRNVYGRSFKHLICHWHVLRDWRRKIRETVSSKLQVEVFEALFTMLSSSEESAFREASEHFADSYGASAREFVRYYANRYSGRAEMWARCFRNFQHGDVDANNFIELYHNRLKTFFTDRTRIKRLDHLLTLLLRVEEEDYARAMEISSKLLSSRHQNGLSLRDEAVTEDYNGTWLVQSITDSGVQYRVCLTDTGNGCRDSLCCALCTEIECAGLCAHTYTCSCSDISPLCEHVHKIHAVRMRPQRVDDSENEMSDDDMCYDTASLDAPEPEPPKSPKFTLHCANISDYQSEETRRLKSAEALCKEIDDIKTMIMAKNFPLQYHDEIRNTIRTVTTRCREIVSGRTKSRTSDLSTPVGSLAIDAKYEESGAVRTKKSPHKSKTKTSLHNQVQSFDAGWSTSSSSTWKRPRVLKRGGRASTGGKTIPLEVIWTTSDNSFSLSSYL